MDEAQFRIPELMLRAALWINVWIPMIRKNPMNEEEETWMRGYVERNGKFLATGWELGDVNPEGRQLNMEVYDMENPMEEMAIRKDLTTDLMAGRIVEWRGAVKGKLPLFVRPKKRDPVTDEVTQWRVIRDGTKGTAENPSVNDLTPDSAAAMRLISHDMLQRVMVIFHMIWGKALMAKTDLEAAFRQFYLKPGETEKICYDVAGRILGDLMNVWGTRTGSRICQDFTAMVSRAYMLWENGRHLREDINAIQEADAAYFRRKIAATFEAAEDDEDYENVWKWTKEDVRSWIKMIGLDPEEEALRNIENGRELVLSHEENMKQKHDEATVGRLRERGFFEELAALKTESKCCITVFVVAYVDDFILIFPPVQDFAERAFKRFTDFLAFNGLMEKAEKRSKVSGQMEAIGVHYDTERMVMDITPTRREKIKRRLYQGLFRESISREDYESLIGQLTYVGQMAWPGLAFVRRMRRRVMEVIRRKGRGDDLIHLEDWEMRDWRWWMMYLDTVTEVDIIERWHSGMIDDCIYVDGATNGSREKRWKPGIGVWWRGHYISKPVPDRLCASFQLRPGAPKKEFAIPHFEMLSIVVAFHNLEQYLTKHRRIVLMTDNTNCEDAIKNKGADDDFLCDAVKWLMMFAVRMDLRIHVRYVNTKKNTEADLLSRFEKRKFRRRVQAECLEQGWVLHEIRVVEYPDIHCW